MRRTATSLVIVAIVCCATDLGAADKDRVAYLLAAMNQARSKLVSGSCVIDGRDENGNLKVTQHFDGARVRCDLVRKNPKSGGGEDIHYFSKDDTVAYSYNTKVNFPGIQIFRASKYVAGYDLPYSDLRTLGLGVFNTAERYSLGKTLSYYQSVFQTATATRQGENWVLRSTLRYNGASVENETVIDESKDFAMMSSTSQYLYEENKWVPLPEEKVVFRSDWENHNGVWVPTRETFTKGGNTVYELSIRWLSVNKSFDQSLLHYRSFPLPSDTPVLDVTTGRGRRVDDVSPPVAARERSRPPTQLLTWRMGLWAGGLSAFVVGVVLMVRRRDPDAADA